MAANTASSLPSPKVALMQPTFMPWLGYFSLIADSDVFVFLDDFQFVRRSFDHRNRFADKAGKETYISLPIKHEGHQEIAFNAAAPMIDTVFRKKFTGTLLHCYGHTEHYAVFSKMLEEWIHEPHATLADINISFITRISDYLGLNTAKFKKSNAISQRGQRSERILSLLEQTNAKTYLCAKGAREYMEEDKVFPVAQCQVAFQDFVPQPYKQGKFPFFSHLSVVDAIMHLGKDGTLQAIADGNHAYKAWNEQRMRA